jgi:error-prone DNA polymerase
MTEVEEIAADLWATGLSAARHPTELVRDELGARGVVTAAMLRELPDRSGVDIAGVVTHRQQPETARGVVFVNLEDETGLVNVICTPDVWKRFRRVARVAPALEIRGVLERHQGVVNVLAHRIVELPLSLNALLKSRDFH